MVTDLNQRAAVPPLTPPQPAPVPQPPAPAQPTLEDYAASIGQFSAELQRQSTAYGHFRGVVAAIEELQQNPHAERPELPQIVIRQPQVDAAPLEICVDMNVLPAAELLQLAPLFTYIEGSAGEELLGAWEGLHRITATTQPIIAAVRQEQQRGA